MRIETTNQALPHGIDLSIRRCGERGHPVLMFLHGFPEGAFVWDEYLGHFASLGTFLRELQNSPEQQAASLYMNFLARPDAPDLLAENDFARLWPFFGNAASPMKPDDNIKTLVLPPEMLAIKIPTQVILGMGDIALRPALLNGLQD